MLWKIEQLQTLKQFNLKYDRNGLNREYIEQAGAELCQAQIKLQLAQLGEGVQINFSSNSVKCSYHTKFQLPGRCNSYYSGGWGGQRIEE